MNASCPELKYEEKFRGFDFLRLVYTGILKCVTDFYISKNQISWNVEMMTWMKWWVARKIREIIWARVRFERVLMEDEVKHLNTLTLHRTGRWLKGKRPVSTYNGYIFDQVEQVYGSLTSETRHPKMLDAIGEVSWKFSRVNQGPKNDQWHKKLKIGRLRWLRSLIPPNCGQRPP